MKQVCGFWLPDHETHLVPFLEKGPQFAGGPTYQFHKLQAALEFVKERDIAVDIGGHCGLWSRPLSHMFKQLIAFEPVADHRECFDRNLADRKNWMLFPFALGDHSGEVSLHTSNTSSGDTFVKEGGEHPAHMRTLDSMELTGIDFIKIDAEGYELFILKGGEETIRKNKPCIIVEQKPGKATHFGLRDTQAIDLLSSWGARIRKQISGDFIMSWDA